MDSQYTHLLQAVVRWLSRGEILNRLFALREVKLFPQQQNMTKFQKFLYDDEWISQLADIFSLLNELNISMQGQLIFNNYLPFGKAVEYSLSKLLLVIIIFIQTSDSTVYKYGKSSLPSCKSSWLVPS